MKILVIDDEKPTLSMFKLFLTAYGYEVITAENGEQGVAVRRAKLALPRIPIERHRPKKIGRAHV